MNYAIRHDLTKIVRRWDAEIDALKREQAKWPMNHVHYRIYEGMKNQQVANLGEVIGLMKKHDGIDQVESKLNNALVEIERLRAKFK